MTLKPLKTAFVEFLKARSDLQGARIRVKSLEKKYTSSQSKVAATLNTVGGPRGLISVDGKIYLYELGSMTQGKMSFKTLEHLEIISMD